MSSQECYSVYKNVLSLWYFCATFLSKQYYGVSFISFEVITWVSENTQKFSLFLFPSAVSGDGTEWFLRMKKKFLTFMYLLIGPGYSAVWKGQFKADCSEVWSGW